MEREEGERERVLTYLVQPGATLGLKSVLYRQYSVVKTKLGAKSNTYRDGVAIRRIQDQARKTLQ